MVRINPSMQKQYCGAWDMVAKAVDEYTPSRKEYQYIEGASPSRPSGFRSRYFAVARTLLRAAEELPKPNGKRLREFRDSNLPAVKQALFSSAPIYDELETFRLSYGLTKLREELGADHPFVKKVLGKKSPQELAQELVKTKLYDVKLREQLWQAGREAVLASNDPMIQLARLVDPDARAVRKWHDEEVETLETIGAERVASAKF